MTSEGNVDSVGLLVLDDLSNELRVDGEEVDLVGETFRGLDGSDVGVDENGVDPLLLESLDRLGSRVVKLSSLTDGKTSGSEDEDLLDRDSRVSSDVVGLETSRHDDGDQLLSDGAIDHVGDEDVEEELGILGSRRGLGVELNREKGETVGSHPDPLVGSVVGVLEELGPSGSESRDVDLVSVVLGGDVAST